MTYLRPWSAKQGLKINPLRHSMISFFFLTQRLFEFVGFVLVCRDFFLHHTATVLVLSILLLTREKENSSLSGPQVDLCWSWLSLQPPFSQNWGRICNSAFLLKCIFFHLFFHLPQIEKAWISPLVMGFSGLSPLQSCF